ncbi:MAG: hypothetical protein OQL16_01380 [Gammaproteobacteria bacterium]|nr:hypothetical protein [Gammaproteobacteria bacterium]
MKKIMLAILLLFSGVIEANEQDDLDDYKILITSFADNFSSCKGGCSKEYDSDEAFSSGIAEQVALMLYRVVPSGIKVGHDYQFRDKGFYWKDRQEHKAVCEHERVDAILSTQMEREESYSYKRDLYIKWFDCQSEDIWEEKIPVEQKSHGWDVQKEVFKYLYFTAPYYLG